MNCNLLVTFIKSFNQSRIKPCLKAKYVFTRKSVASVYAITMQLAWLDLRTRDTNVCVRLVTRENIVKKVRPTMRCIKHIYHPCMCPLYQFKFRSVNFHISSEQLRCKYNTLYPFLIFVSFRYSRPMGYFVSSRVVYRALIICLDIDECSNNTHNCHAKAVFIISRSLTVIDIKRVLRGKDEILWLSSE